MRCGALGWDAGRKVCGARRGKLAGREARLVSPSAPPLSRLTPIIHCHTVPPCGPPPPLRPRVLAPLPIESLRVERHPDPTESHVMGTVPMGADPATSVVDAKLLHHRARNLAVLGASAFPTAPPANPTRTLSALSVRAARHSFGP